MRARSAPLGPLDQPLSEADERLLYRLLSDPTKYPMQLKTWLIAWLEGSDLSVPISSVSGLLNRLGEIQSTLRTGLTLGGLASGVCNPDGNLAVLLPEEVVAIRSVVLTNSNTDLLNCTFSSWGWTTTGFNINGWNVPLNTNLVSRQFDVCWHALVTPKTAL